MGIKTSLYVPREKKKMKSGYQCFREPVADDLMYEGKKILGGAEKRVHDHFLYQGSLLLSGLGTAGGDYFALFEKVKQAVLLGMRRRFGVMFVGIDVSLEDLQEANQLREKGVFCLGL